jgi:diguanylate cyclase (GGDEF)-like protein
MCDFFIYYVESNLVCCIILMLTFYIQSMEALISMDPPTKLNNRGQLFRYVSQETSLRMENRPTFVVMLDVNDFKAINDTYGHAEGDRALVIIANSLRERRGALWG